MGQSEEDPETFFVERVKQVLAHIDNMKIRTQATTLAALWSFTGVEEYRVQMRKVSDEIREIYKDQLVEEHRRGSWVTFHQISEIGRAYHTRFTNHPSLETATNALITGLMSGMYPGCPPRRLMDYTEMKVRNFDADDNYINDGVMIFNKYKTVKKDKEKGIVSQLQVPAEMVPIIEYVKKNTLSDYLLNNTLGAKFTSASLHKRLFSIFGFSVDMLRSIYLSEMHEGTPSIRDMESTAKNMGNSVGSQLGFYVKK